MTTERPPRRLGAAWPALAAAAALVVAGTVATLEWPAQRAVLPAEAPAPRPPTPAAPVAPRVEPGFDVVRVGPDGGVVIAGRAEPGADVVVRDGERTVGAARADRNGEFVIVPDGKLPPGGRELTLSARLGEGPEQAAGASVVLVVPPPASTPAAGPAPVALLVPNAGAPRLLNAPEHRGGLSLDTVDYDDKGDIRFAGSAAPTMGLRVYVDNTAVGETKTDARGQWELTPAQPVSPGLHRLRVDQLGAGGRVLSRVELPFQRVMQSVDVAPGRVIVQPGQNLWRIARRAYGTGTRYTVIYLANREQIRDPRLIYPGQTFATPGATP
ncbi:MAG: hypothetical protein NVS2B11_10470 [Acetobacteraceae bacterium]